MATAPSWPDLAQGQTGKNVSALQCLLNYRNNNTALAVDGSFGPAVKSAVIAYQQANGLSADGIAGANTLSKLVAVVQSGAVNNAVKAAQYLLSKFETIATDGSFGPGCLSTVKTFQQKMGIDVDGSVGPTTWRYLFGYNAYPSSSGTSKILSMPSGPRCNWSQHHSGVTQYFGSSACTLVAGLDAANFYATNGTGYTPANMNSSTYWISGAGYTWIIPGPGKIGSKISYTTSQQPAALSYIKTQIDAGCPVLISIGTSSSSNHTVFGYGYKNGAASYADIYVYDPANVDTSSIAGRDVDLYNAMDYNHDYFNIWNIRPTSRG